MKKKDIWISIAIIAATALMFRFYWLRKGSVEIDAGGATAELQLHSSWLSKATITSVAEIPQIGAQIHRPQRLSLSMKQDGQTWQIDCYGPWGDLSKIKVKNNRTTTLRLGPPFLIKPSVSKSGSLIAIEYAILGQAGEQYQNSASKNGSAVTGTGFTIVDETGNVLQTGKFQYG